MNFNFPKIIIITGHYGCGKTNVSVNIALKLASEGKKVTVIDLDIVNPYFRTADFEDLFKSKNVELRAPMYANSNLDIPALNYDLASIIDGGGYVVIDVGGDDAGAVALGRYSDVLKDNPDAKMYYVVNKFRYLTREPEEALELMHEIELASQLKCAGIINNSNIGEKTDAEAVKKGVAYGEKIAEKVDIPLLMNCAEKKYLEGIDNAFDVEIYVKPIWEKENL